MFFPRAFSYPLRKPFLKRQLQSAPRRQAFFSFLAVLPAARHPFRKTHCGSHHACL
jgi:hypothetical protein